MHTGAGLRPSSDVDAVPVETVVSVDDTTSVRTTRACSGVIGLAWEMFASQSAGRTYALQSARIHKSKRQIILTMRENITVWLRMYQFLCSQSQQSRGRCSGQATG
nr:hypothetical protein CFP56_57649 [Quercus suber]